MTVIHRLNIKIILGILSGLLPVVFYWHVLNFNYVWDDIWLLTVRLPNMTFADCFRNMPLGAEMSNPYFRPLLYLPLYVEKLFFGYHLKIFHLNNIILHAMSALLVYFLALKIFHWHIYKYYAAFLSALLFAVHPSHAEVVSWISALPDACLTCFALLALVSHIQFRHKNKRSWLVVSLISILLALLSKETGVILIALFVVYDVLFWYQKGRVQIRLFRVYAWYVAVYVLWIVLRAMSSIRSPDFNIGGIPFQQIKEVFLVFGFYIRKMINPVPLFPSYVGLPLDFMGSAIFFVCLFLFVVYLLFQFNKKTIFVVGLFLFPLLPPLSLAFMQGLSNITIAERYIYFSSTGFALILGALFLGVVSLIHKYSKIMMSGMTVVMLLASFWYIQNAYRYSLAWKDEMSLWKYVITVNPLMPGANSAAGMAYMEKDEFDKALPYLEHHDLLARDSKSTFALRYNNLLIHYTNTNNVDAIQKIIEFLNQDQIHEVKPLFGLAYHDYWDAKRGHRVMDYQKLIAQLEQSAEDFTGNALGFYFLGILHNEQGRRHIGDQYLSYASKLSPLYPLSDKVHVYRPWSLAFAFSDYSSTEPK